MTLHALDCCKAAGLTATLFIYNPTAMGTVESRFQAVRGNGEVDARCVNILN